ncbi:MAG: hypothetical protein M1821_000168 [Bathelium mastoideum]|nr:MAG: hypothetical protein M1821_000168 [Bathelium mastoideum]KAI9687798.1 MAG: hypothetical protein M1822_001878 [Bathelium mastoideum]
MADTSQPTPHRASPSEISSLKTQYLILYNFASAVLWFTVLGRTALLVPLVGYANIYGGVGEFTKWTQTLALLEIVHSALGLIRAPLSTTLLQVASRLFLVHLIVGLFPHLTTPSLAYPSMLLAWSITETVRYSYFACALALGSPRRVPDWLVWLRYNLFFVLYPMGIQGETWLVGRVAGGVDPRREGAWARWVKWGCWGALLVYVPGAYILYTHMMAQRRKVMKGKAREE